MSTRHLFLFALAALACAGPSTTTSRVEEPVTAQNLLAKERYWPYRVALVEAVPSSPEPLPRGFTGVLVRVEPDGSLRVDFGARGKLSLTVEQTDVLARANRIRTGEDWKQEPNFVHAIQTRMLDPGSDPLGPLPVEQTRSRRAFLCVFADPSSAEFDEIALALAPLREREPEGLLTILFPQGRHADTAVQARLRELSWSVPFLYDFLSEPYTRSLLEEGTPLPTVVLQTDEGRLVYQGGWRREAPAQLLAAWKAISRT